MKNKFTTLRSLAVLALSAAVLVVSCKREQQVTRTHDVTDPVETTWSVIPGQYIVVYKTDAIGNPQQKIGKNPLALRTYIENATGEMFADHNIAVSKEKISQIYSNAINGFCAILSDEELRLLQTDYRVAYIEKDMLVTLGKPGSGGGSTQPAQTTPAGITRVNGASYTGTSLAWILDSGIDLDHPDLNVNTSKGFNAFKTGADSKSLDDGNGHGTHCAGIVAAKNNTIGVVGVAAGATVVPVKVLNSQGSGSYSGVIAGVDHVAANAGSGDVANMSLGGPTSTALDDAIKNAASKGIKFVLAAGNESSDANNYSPSRVNGTNIYTISAMNSSDVFASFSNYGTSVDYCAPGVSIYSTYKNGTYATLSGTSMAAPHAAGVMLHGSWTTDGTVKSDPDGTADPIIKRN